MRLGFHYHVPATAKNGIIYTQGSQGVFLDSLAPYCEKIICFLHSPRPEEAYQCNYSIQSKNVEFVNIGLHRSVPQRMFLSRKYTSFLNKRKKDIDILLIRGPSPLLPQMAKRIPQVSKCLLLVASYKDGVDSLPQPTWRKELIRIWSNWNEDEQLKIAKKSLTFVNSNRLYNNLKSIAPNLIETRTTTISLKDIKIREDTCHKAPYHILFSGRITAEKGINDIMHALAILRSDGIDCFFDLVGMPETDNYLKEVMNSTINLGLTGRIQYHGCKTVGEELLDYYYRADIFVIASRSSEGFPRTIWEAFSQSTPVIATKVGSIPLYLRHEQDALLAAPHSPEELAMNIKRLILEPELRKRLMVNGRKLAEENTLDFRAKEMMKNIEGWVTEKSKKIVWDESL